MWGAVGDSEDHGHLVEGVHECHVYHDAGVSLEVLALAGDRVARPYKGSPHWARAIPDEARDRVCLSTEGEAASRWVLRAAPRNKAVPSCVL